MSSATAAAMAAADVLHAVLNLHLFETAAFGAGKLIAMFSAQGARLHCPGFPAIRTFKYPMFHK